MQSTSISKINQCEYNSIETARRIENCNADSSIFSEVKYTETNDKNNSPVISANKVDSDKNFEKHQEYEKLTTFAYYKTYKEDYNNWEAINETKNDENGFFARVFKDSETNEVVISYRGTNMDYDNMMDDMTSNEDILKGKIPRQYSNAKELYDKIKKENPNSEITLTGHSLGGSLAQMVASTDKNTTAVTFNAVGTKKIVDNNSEFKDNKNCINYNTSQDVPSNMLDQVGELRTVDIGGFPPKIFKNGAFASMKEGHDLSNFDNIKDSNYLESGFVKENTKKLKEEVNGITKTVGIIPNITGKVDKVVKFFGKIKDFFVGLKDIIVGFFK